METAVPCSQCGFELADTATFCNQCGFPERGPSEDKARYFYTLKQKKEMIEEAERKMNHIKIFVLVLAGINFLYGLYLLSSEYTFAEGLGSIICAAVFVGCAIWINKQPLTGILAAFAFWLLLQLSSIFIDPVNILQGIILKVVFISMFIKGISSAKEAQKYRKQLAEIKAI